MKLDLLTAAFPELTLDEIAEWAAANDFDALEVACWPAGEGAARRYAARGLLVPARGLGRHRPQRRRGGRARHDRGRGPRARARVALRAGTGTVRLRDVCRNEG